MCARARVCFYCLVIHTQYPSLSVQLLLSEYKCAHCPVCDCVCVCWCPLTVATVGLSEKNRLAPIFSITVIRILHHSHRYKHSLLLSCRMREEAVSHSHRLLQHTHTHTDIANENMHARGQSQMSQKKRLSNMLLSSSPSCKHTSAFLELQSFI